MTMATTPAALLSSPELRRGLAAMLRRRVPADEVPDLMQTVLCDALASARLPESPEEIARWVSGIARHKVADYRRRAGRAMVAPESCASELACPEEPAPFEAREILGEVMSSSRCPRDRETLEWIVREHEGEALAAIAAEEGVPSPQVRKRVSRFRQVLRARYALAAFVALLVGAGVLASRGLSDDPLAVISPEPTGALAGGFEGNHRIVSHVLSEATPKATRAIVERELSGATLDIGAHTVTVHGASATLVRSVSGVRRVGPNELRAELRDAKGHVTHVVARKTEASVTITVLDGPARGSFTLVRR